MEIGNGESVKISPAQPEDKYENVLVCCPSHDGRVSTGTGQALWAAATYERRVIAVSEVSSLLVSNCNNLWALMLNERHNQKIGWFAMLHSDVSPENGWVDKLIAEANRCHADVLSAVAPIKDDRGYTSTAIENPADPWVPWCRLTMTQVCHRDFPTTFDAKNAAGGLECLPDPIGLRNVPRSRLLTNTGCMVIRLRGQWIENAYFDSRDTIRRMPDGKYRAFTQPEDWRFTRRAAEAGAIVMATKAVKLNHKGQTDFPNDQAWGNPRDVHFEKLRAELDSAPLEMHVAVS